MIGLKYQSQLIRPSASPFALMMDVAELLWWDSQFRGDSSGAAEGVHYEASFFPALLRACERDLPSGEELSLDELRVLLRFCLVEDASSERVTQQDVRHPPLFSMLQQRFIRLTFCFCVPAPSSFAFSRALGRWSLRSPRPSHASP